MDKNYDSATVNGFGDEWTRFDQVELSSEEANEIFSGYFSIFPWHRISKTSIGFDMGCGSGRWARLMSQRVGSLHCIEPSDAYFIAKKNLLHLSNCYVHRGSVDTNPLSEKSMDFGYSLGVLHHIPDTQAALVSCVRKLKVGAPFLVYIYYAFDNKPLWFRLLWKVSDYIRIVVSRMPNSLRFYISQLLATVIYFPLTRLSLFMEWLGFDVTNYPLSAYRMRSFYTMRTDALDRFGTRLEQRFTKSQIHQMMEKAGLEKIIFNEEKYFYCALGYAKDLTTS